MEVIDRFTLWGAPSDVKHIKVNCPVGRWFTMPTDALAQPRVGPRRPVTVTDTTLPRRRGRTATEEQRRRGCG